ncbi:probable E3 ubiquitin-protein ligase HERC4 [Uranotaenia lowii]|uniref:probable E3 ubiquitin-protein ligase HERC4 n=1 Tax=Uranotaenia lowii TaxID=190385 RepID=UPI00247923E4|nr:probable E3 ubiquitin-protein ligase HERC4 [Uranotaenia lowii]
MSDKVLIAGFNPFYLSTDGLIKEIEITNHLSSKLVASEGTRWQLELTATHGLIAVNRTILAISAISQQSHHLSFDHEIAQLSASTWHCLVLLHNGDLYRYDFHQNHALKLEFLGVENLATDDTERDRVTHVACGDRVSVAVSSSKTVFNIPNRTFRFPKHTRIAKVSVGLEHCLLLTGNGDVYSWGGGLRGQLGNGEITQYKEEPQLIEALAGIKIVDIAAGGWHSGAISSFGDLYSWGWNSKGQLGLKDECKVRGSVFPLPQLIDISVGIEEQEEISLARVYCGKEFTLILDSRNRIFVSGIDLSQTTIFSSVQREFKIDGFKPFEMMPTLKEQHRINCGPCSVAFERDPPK